MPTVSGYTTPGKVGLNGCEEMCWTPARCPVHDREMNPRGCSLPMGVSDCCYRADVPLVNPRHLWSVHDSNRCYNDPEGWAAHEASCVECRGDDE